MDHYADNIPFWTDSCKILTKEMIPFPGLHMIGYAQYSSSIQLLPNHYHKTKEFTIILNGTQDYSVKNNIFTLHGKDIFMTHPYEGHGNNGNPQAICEYVWLQLDILDSACIDNFLGLPKPFGQYVYSQVANYNLRVKTTNVNEISRLKQAFFCFASGKKSKQLLGHSILIQFIVTNLCETSAAISDSTYSPNIQKAISYIHEHAKDTVTVDQLAQQAGLSTPRFISNFKNQIGITPHAYILSIKINEAKAMLQNGSYSITEIANALNFSSSNHFSAAFKKHTGYTPSYYRSLHSGSADFH